MSLAERGATVKGVDFQEENIAVCRALANENPQLDASFATGRIEEVIDALEPGQYDLAIGLSVFHHIVHLHGVARTQRWLARLASCTEAMILELALRGSRYIGDLLSRRTRANCCAIVLSFTKSRVLTRISPPFIARCTWSVNIGCC
ncbi:hypothetical protein SODG_001532 [Sodalis praecaptivus]